VSYEGPQFPPPSGLAPPSNLQAPPPGYGQQQSWPQQSQPPPGYYGPPTGYNGPPRRKRHRIRNTFLAATGALVLLVVIVAVASSGNGVVKDTPPAAGNSAGPSGSSSSASQTNSSQSDSNTTGPLETTFTVTDTNDNGATVKYSVTLDKVIQTARPDNSFDGAPAGKHLTAAEFTIKGISGNEQDDSNSDAAAIGANSQTYQPGFEGLAAGTNFNGGDFNSSPGSTSVGWVAFEVKNGVKITSIEWSPSGGFDGVTPATWNLGG
jgi:hypothetical protein